MVLKVLQSVFKGRFAIGIKFLLNLELPIPHVADYILILFGVGMTILMQSGTECIALALNLRLLPAIRYAVRVQAAILISIW